MQKEYGKKYRVGVSKVTIEYLSETVLKGFYSIYIEDGVLCLMNEKASVIFGVRGREGAELRVSFRKKKKI